MPEGPELHLASCYINTACAGLVFSGKVEKSEVSKNPAVPFESDEYLISATSRGKEVKLSLSPVKEEDGGGGAREPMDIVFRFGMSGYFTLSPAAQLPKHAHLRFYTRESPRRALCFVDTRRFGSWEALGTWQPERGPCVMLEYAKFRENVLSNLAEKAFDRPICEVLINQKYFNGIGNYLRAEILYRLKIPPFVKARTVLDPLLLQNQDAGLTLSKKVKVKKKNPDLLELCHSVPMEVIHLGGKGYDPTHRGDPSVFENWLRCYCVPGMKSLRDGNGRTIWFQGEPGPLGPKAAKSKKKRRGVKADPEAPRPKEFCGCNEKADLQKKENELPSLGQEAAESLLSRSRSLQPTASRCSRRSRLSSSFVGKTSKENEGKADETLAQAVFASGAPLSITANRYWKEHFKLLCPSYMLPPHYRLSQSLLERVCARVRTIFIQRIGQAESLTLAVGGTDVQGDDLLNIKFVTQEPIFLKRIATRSSRHTGESIALLSERAKSARPSRVEHLLIDSACNMKAARQILKARYLHLIVFGCLALGLNLLAKDSVSVNTMKTVLANCKAP
ncbi:endonuclease 8-like 1 isoform X1 [Rhinatrema bivittatum]|uniref:endonuclease 8-like 1 isoform X1 n=1 Tax=Rhinatrema bivittatum TaxID=194408 RepID=UPI00112CAB79|nr:endonuclease 8-like 1 isoform X1 [Rhinatrema bivittatum]XP_029431831.1 endonuclease 8-like 1 isoform X1 [Rhinatrema bivittatum]XP_029431832.1 endonuclease 8-like 1 isoform X1 [Rhinatrema bivittatum]